MLILGVTGSICSGKTFVSSLFNYLDCQVFDADKLVHSVYDKELKSHILSIFPEVRENFHLKRSILLNLFIKNDPRWIFFQNKVHEIVLNNMKIFVKMAFRKNYKKIVLDIPLLFESGMNHYCDSVVVVRVNSSLRRERVMRRGIRMEIYEAILQRQISDVEKCNRADYVINNGLNKANALFKVKNILADLCENKMINSSKFSKLIHRLKI